MAWLGFPEPQPWPGSRPEATHQVTFTAQPHASQWSYSLEEREQVEAGSITTLFMHFTMQYVSWRVQSTKT